MSSHFDQSSIKSLEITATTAAAYLDACDYGASKTTLNPSYYRCCGDLLFKIFTLFDPKTNFPSLLDESAAARDVAESILIGNHIKLSRRGYYPELAVLLNRVTTI